MKHFANNLTQFLPEEDKADSQEKLTLEEFYKKLYMYELFDFQKQLIKAMHEKQGVAMLLATRGIGKTDLITALLTLYKVYINPLERVLIITNRSDRAKNILHNISSYIKNNMDVFGDIFDDRGITKTKIRTKNSTDKGVSIGYASLGSDLRGDRPTYIVIDDILTMENSHHAIKRRNAQLKYQEATSLCKNISIIGNATHEDDLYSNLKLADNVDLLEVYNDHPLLPDMFKINKEDKQKQGLSDRTIMANYYGVLIGDELLPYANTLVMGSDSLEQVPDLLSLNCFFDFSGGGNDYNALSIIFVYNYKIYVLGIAKRDMWSNFIELATPIIKKLGINKVFYENNQVGREPSKIMELDGINAVGIPSKTNKEHKISRMEYLRDDIILIQDNTLQGNDDFIRLFKGYSTISKCNDDANDCVAMNLIQMRYIK
jgi:hypothetical protein